MIRWAVMICGVAVAADSPQVTFQAISPTASGLQWTHNNGASAEKHLPETVGAGVAVLDADGDGWMDLFFVNSGASDFWKPSEPISNALYRNNHDGTFSDVTEKAGLRSTAFGMGAFPADFDGDGDTDLLITNYGSLRLLRNTGGQFTDVTTDAGLAAEGWFTHAVWFDYDKDGRVDLFVSSFVKYTPGENRFCGDASAKRQHYCIPRVFRPTPSRLYRGLGGGKFADVSGVTGIASVEGKAFGAVATDINNDGWLDLFVANDTVANFLFVNQQGKKFVEMGLPLGVAYSEGGNPRSGMGVDAGDVNGDGWQDLFVANIDQEMFAVYENQAGVEFIDAQADLRRVTRLMSGWGARFFDYDNDGDADLFLVNGHPDDMVSVIKPLVTFAEPMLLFRNDGGRLHDVSSASGEVFREALSGRGMATVDFDNDGDLDVVVTVNGGRPLLLRNEGGNRNGWVGLELAAKKSDPSAAGTLLRWSAGGRTFRRLRAAGGSYLSSHDPREVLGIGAAEAIDWIEVRWPSGVTDRVEKPPLRRYLKLVEGAGTPP